MPNMKTYRAEGRSAGGFLLEVETPNGLIFVDQPAGAGGTGNGATPVDHLFASLAGCIVTTARIIARQRKIDAGEIVVRVEGALDLDVIRGTSSDGRSGLTGISVEVALGGTLDAAAKGAFLDELRRRCPVADNIAGETPLNLRLTGEH